jgi:hypothetical protein
VIDQIQQDIQERLGEPLDEADKLRRAPSRAAPSIAAES